jgi:serine/threonine protein kinase
VIDATGAGLARTLSDRYTIDGKLGEGGMATVYLSHDLRQQRKVAIRCSGRSLPP